MSVAYRIDPEAPRFAFVRTQPRGLLYIRTHVAVVFVACPTCGVAEAIPCMSARGLMMASTHYTRRDAYAALLRKRRHGRERRKA